jgi:hypothetical protein
VRARFALAGVTLALLTLSAAATASAATPVTRHPAPGTPLSLSLPRSWITVDANDVAKGAADALAKNNPQLAEVLKALSQPGTAARLFAFDPVIVEGFATNVNVIEVSIPGGITIDEYARLLRAELEGLAQRTGKLSVRIVRIPAGAAVRSSYRIKVNLDNAKFVIASLTQIGMLRGRTSYIVTYTTLASRLPHYKASFEASIRSIRLKP